MTSEPINEFISRWSKATPSERANSQLFLSELCDLLGLPHPDATRDLGYAFEFPVTQHHPDGSMTPGRIDLYRRGCFVLESKQFQAAQAAASQLELAAQQAGVAEKKKSSQPMRGTGAWDDAMIKARGQAERYVRSLPASEPTAPFLIVVDVGHSFEIFADFTQAGKAFLHFPDPRSFRIRLEHLADDRIRERLKLIRSDPASLDPARRSADVTLADRLNAPRRLCKRRSVRLDEIGIVLSESKLRLAILAGSAILSHILHGKGIHSEKL